MRVVHPGQKVVTSAGTVVTVAIIQHDKVWAFTSRGLQQVIVRCDAFGGEHDLTMGLLNAA